MTAVDGKNARTKCLRFVSRQSALPSLCLPSPVLVANRRRLNCRPPQLAAFEGARGGRGERGVEGDRMTTMGGLCMAKQ